MPNIKSAKKRVIISEKKAARNTSAKSSLRTSVKKAKIRSKLLRICLRIKSESRFNIKP